MPSPLLPFFHKMAGHAAGLLGISGAFAAIDFKDEVTLGTIIVTCVIVAIAGLFTIRAKIANVWREDAEGQRSAKEHIQEQLNAERLERVEFEKQQQLLRHDLKDQIAGLRLQLQAAEARTDLTTALETIRHMNETTVKTVTDAISRTIEERDGQIHSVLVEIRDYLRREEAT